MNVFIRRKQLIAIILLAALTGADNLLYGAHAWADRLSLAGVELQVAERYAEVSRMTPVELANRIKAGEPILILDAREVEEFAVSRLPGAERVDPGIWHSSFIKRYGARVRGRTVVFYCSVGVRSSKLAEYVQDAVVKAGATSVYNLQGGIFAWHNQKRALVNSAGRTDFVHPYDARWGQLVEQQSQTRYEP